MTHEVGTIFSNGDGMGTYIHMLSTAMGAQFSLMFSQTNVSLAAWAGFDTRMDKVWMAAVMSTLTYAATAGICPWINLPSVIRGWAAWDEDVIYEYYGMDPFNNREWLSYTPYPHYYIQQWAKKLQTTVGEDKCKLAMVPVNGEYKLMVPMDHTTLQYRSLWACTTDTSAYFPMVMYQEQASAASPLSAWVDQWSFVTNTGARHYIDTPRNKLSSNELVITLKDNTQANAPNICAWVLRTSYVHNDDKFRGMFVSDLVWPDPISMEQIIEASKNYLLYPGISALLGYVSGGPVGAAVAGGTHLANNVIKAALPEEKKEKALEVTQKIGDAVTKIYGEKVHVQSQHDQEAMTNPLPPGNLPNEG